MSRAQLATQAGLFTFAVLAGIARWLTYNSRPTHPTPFR